MPLRIEMGRREGEFRTYVFWSSSSNTLRMKRAESPYDRMVDMPTSASEKLMKMGERVTLCGQCQRIHLAAEAR
jgi:hypothetical protein